MTVKELKKLIKKLPDDMLVMTPHGTESIITVCYSNSEVVEIELEDDLTDEVLLLVPCMCDIVTDEIPMDIHDN